MTPKFELKIPTIMANLLEKLPHFVENKTKIVIALVACLCAGKTIQYFRSWRNKQRLLQKIATKRHQCREALEELRTSLSFNEGSLEKQRTILQLSVEDLLQQMKDDKLNPIEVLEAYQRAALDAHEKTNCLIEPFKEARAWAERLKSQPKGLLYGLPIALKDDHAVKGYDTTLGCAQWIGMPVADDCLIVKALMVEGAIPFMKTNVPQLMMSIESTNCIFGVTVNPHDATRGAGGSSGGTGALIGSGGCLVGSGSDLAGSIRIPAAFNGVCGFKPTTCRISAKGMAGNLFCPDIVPITYGPLAKTVAGIVLYMKALWSGYMFENDPYVSRVPFQEQDFTNKAPLRVGYFVQIGNFPIPPAYERAVHLAKSALERSGHTVVPFTIPYTEKMFRFAGLLFSGDGGETLGTFLNADIVDKIALGDLATVTQMPNWLRKVMFCFVKPFSKMLYYTLALTSHQCKTVAEWWVESKKKKRIMTDIIEVWKDEGLDGILCPAFGSHACPVGQQPPFDDTLLYTFVYNVLECPAGVVPVTTVSQEDEDRAKNLPENDFPEQVLKKGMENSTGLPIAVQCAALPNRDEICLRLMADIERNIKQN